MPVSRALPQKPLVACSLQELGSRSSSCKPCQSRSLAGAVAHPVGPQSFCPAGPRFPSSALLCVKQPVSLAGGVAGLGRRCCLDRRWALFAQEKRGAGLGLMTGKILAGCPWQLYFPAIVLLRLPGRGNRWVASETITLCRLSRVPALVDCSYFRAGKAHIHLKQWGLLLSALAGVSCLISSDALMTAASSAFSSLCVPSTPPWLAALEVSLLSCC